MRLLDDGDKIEYGDEFLDDKWQWKPLKKDEWCVGMDYESRFFVPMRRKLSNAALCDAGG